MDTTDSSGVEPEDNSPAIGRRAMIAKAVTAGAIVWTAPLVLGSTASATKPNPVGTCAPGRLYAAKFHRYWNPTGRCWDPVDVGYYIEDNNGNDALDGCNIITRTSNSKGSCSNSNRIRTSTFTIAAGYSFAQILTDPSANRRKPSVVKNGCYFTNAPSSTVTHDWGDCSDDDEIVVIAVWGPPA
jgi:hypothetical protein